MLVSIITINYNNCSGLKKTAESVISQTYSDYEWIVVDGGSTDGSTDILKQYESYITYGVSERDKGIYNAMNKGIVHATGDYLLFMNSGDCFADATVLSNVIAVGLDKDFVYGDAVEIKQGKLVPVNRIMSEHITAKDLIQTSLPHQATFIKRTVFEQYGYYDESYRIVSDWKFFFDVIVYGNASVKHIPIRVAVFEGGGISEDAFKKGDNERDLILQKVLPPRMKEDYELVYSLADIKRHPFSYMLYKVLYKITMLFEKNDF